MRTCLDELKIGSRSLAKIIRSVHVRFQYFWPQNIIGNDGIKAVLIIKGDVVLCWVRKTGEITIRRDICEPFWANASSACYISCVTRGFESARRTLCSSMYSRKRQQVRARIGRWYHCSKADPLQIRIQKLVVYTNMHETNPKSSCRRGSK